MSVLAKKIESSEYNLPCYFFRFLCDLGSHNSLDNHSANSISLFEHQADISVIEKFIFTQQFGLCTLSSHTKELRIYQARRKEIDIGGGGGGLRVKRPEIRGRQPQIF